MNAFEAIGRKVRAAVAVLVPVGFYTSAMWFFFSNFGGQVALALALTLPLMLLPAALIWYINIGGIYQTIRHRCEGYFLACAE